MADEELTPEALDAWERRMDEIEAEAAALQRARAEVDRLSAAAVAGFRQHYERREVRDV